MEVVIALDRRPATNDSVTRSFREALRGKGRTIAPTGNEQRIEIDGIAVRWLEHGDDHGPPAVLIHGIPTSPALWRRVVPSVGGVRLLAWEMVGYGRSWAAGRGRDISVRAQADYLLRWIEGIGIERAVLVGHDLGGGVAQIAAVRAPERCAGLVLSNAIAYDSWPIPSVKAIRAGGSLVERMPRAIFKRQLQLFVRQGHRDADRARESFEQHWAGYDHPDGPRAFIRQVRSLRTEDTLEVAAGLRDLDVPAALVWGAADRFQKLEYGRRLAADLSAELDPIPGARHFVPEDEPERVATAVQRIVERAFGTGAFS